MSPYCFTLSPQRTGVTKTPYSIKEIRKSRKRANHKRADEEKFRPNHG